MKILGIIIIIIILFKILNYFLKKIIIKFYIRQLYALYSNENINNPYRLGFYKENDYPKEILKDPINSLGSLLYYFKMDYNKLHFYILKNHKNLVLWHKEVCAALIIAEGKISYHEEYARAWIKDCLIGKDKEGFFIESNLMIGFPENEEILKRTLIKAVFLKDIEKYHQYNYFKFSFILELPDGRHFSGFLSINGINFKGQSSAIHEIIIMQEVIELEGATDKQCEDYLRGDFKKSKETEKLMAELMNYSSGE